MMPRTNAPAMRSKKKLDIGPLRLFYLELCSASTRGWAGNLTKFPGVQAASGTPAEPLCLFTGQIPGFGVGRKDVVYLVHRRTRHPFQYALDHGSNPGKRKPAFEERRDGNFIGCVQGARQRAALAQRRLGQAEARKLAHGNFLEIELMQR